MSAWHELVIQGPEKAARAFVAGFAAGRGEHGEGVFGSDLDLDAESLGERLRELFAVGSHHLLLVPERVAAPLAEALAERGAELGLRVERQRIVESASFAFRAEVFSRELAESIRGALLTSPPPGVRIEDLSESEETHPEAKGPELYAPIHAYIYRVSGRITGSLPGIFEAWRRAREQDFVEVGTFRVEGKIL
jgi:hypothetical protein